MSLDGLEALRTRFRTRTIDEASAIRAWQDAGRPVSDEVERTIHNIAGAAGTFGLARLHEAAAAVDDAFATGAPVTETAVQALLDAIADLDA